MIEGGSAWAWFQVLLPLLAPPQLLSLPPAIPIAVAVVHLALWLLTQRRLGAFEPLPWVDAEEHVPLPRTCLCIPVRNEARELGAALDSWLAQEHPELRILVVDDASTDGSPEILAERAARDPRLRILRTEGPPPGWLGKNHALHRAAQEPEARQAEWLLFTDGDVCAEPGLLRRAFAQLQAHPTELLTLLPGLDLRSRAERLYLPFAFAAIFWGISPRRVRDPRSRFYCGSGAFMLVSRQAYEAAGGHGAAPLEPIDDMMLARRVKRAGGRLQVRQGGPDLHLRAYHGLGEILRAQRKNILGFRPLLWLSPLLLFLVPALFLSPLILALGGWPLTGLALWLLVPAMTGDIHQRFTAAPMDPLWAFWPLVGPLCAVSIAWAMADRLRGVNSWRGREIRIRG